MRRYGVGLALQYVCKVSLSDENRFSVTYDGVQYVTQLPRIAGPLILLQDLERTLRQAQAGTSSSQGDVRQPLNGQGLYI